ncbi:modification methylase SinI [Glutamicibacter sp. BW80]|nr:modification methylase SinI [Glutamicibacter sp. BW80]
MKPSQAVGVREASELLKVSPQIIRRYLREGRLTGIQIGRTWCIDSSALAALARETGAVVVTENQTREKVPSEKMKVLSFFSGAMGLDLGLERAGLETILACEFDKWCRQTIMTNRPGLPLLGDIWQYTPDQIRDTAGLGPDDEIDVIAGGPPCQAFSTAGARRGFADIRGNVFLHFIDLIAELKPRYAVLENVRGLLSAALRHRPLDQRGKGFPALEPDEQPGGALAFVVQKLKSAGYTVSFNLYNAANYGSAQVRERVVVICTRDGERVPYLPPTHSKDGGFGLTPWRTFNDAVSTPEAIQTHDHLAFPEKRLKYYRMLSSGQYWKHLPENLQKEALGQSYFSGGGKTGFLRRLAWDKPSPTLVTHPAMPATDLAHPEELRPLSVQEYKRLQDFDDSWQLSGPLLAQYKQLGNAVPVRLGEAIGRALIAHEADEIWDELDGFPYSRYKNTSDRHLEEKNFPEIEFSPLVVAQ